MRLLLLLVLASVSLCWGLLNSRVSLYGRIRTSRLPLYAVISEPGLEDNESSSLGGSDEWAALDAAVASDPAAFEAACAAKLAEWKNLKASGALDAIGDSTTAEDVEALDDQLRHHAATDANIDTRVNSDDSGSSRGRENSIEHSRKKRVNNKSMTAEERADAVGAMADALTSATAQLQLKDEHQIMEGYAVASAVSTARSASGSFSKLGLSPSKEVAAAEYSAKLSKVGARKGGSAAGVMTLLQDMQSKECLVSSVVEAALFALSRLGSVAHMEQAVKLYRGWVQNGVLKGKHASGPFGVRLACSCHANGLPASGNAIQIEVLEARDPGVTSAMFAPGIAVAALSGGASEETVAQTLQAVHSVLPQLDADLLNPVVRALGRQKRTWDIFALLDSMRAAYAADRKHLAKLLPNEETMEFLANALVASVTEEGRARSMKELPKPSADMREVLLVGRSNVGKSSLVNFLVNRKALASVSAVPGHTTQFHFFAVNQGHTDIPAFRLVDVPGLGYAEAAEEKQMSWRGLLERYLAVRQNLGLVLHLVDARHGLTPTDATLLRLAYDAAAARAADVNTSTSADACADSKLPLRYAVVLTKCDRVKQKDLQRTIEEVQAGLLEASAAATATAPVAGGADGGSLNAKLLPDVPVLQTSVVSKQGKDSLWQLLQGFLQPPHK